MGIASAIGRGLTAGGEVGLKAAFEDRAAKIQATRDARLQQYAQQNMASQQQFQSSENQLGREFQGSENAAGRDLTRSEGVANRDQQGTIAARRDYLAGAQLSVQEETARRQYDLHKESADRESERQAVELEGAYIDLNQKRDLAEAYKTVMDETLDEATRQKALNKLNLLEPKGQDKPRYSLYTGPSADGFSEEMYRLDKISGEVKSIGPDGSLSPAGQIGGATQSGLGQGSQAKDPDGGGEYTQENPAKPKTAAEAKALPRGAYFVHPGTGELWRAKGQ